MTGMTDNAGHWPRSGWRRAMWGAAAGLLLLPAVAMRFSAAVDWDATDFIVMGLLLATACAAIDLGMRRSGHLAYRAGVAVGVGGGFLLVWINLAVGVLGSEDNPANLMYLGVLATGVIGAGLTRFRARGMAITMLAMAAAQVMMALIAIAIAATGPGPLVEIAGVTAFFLAPWLLSAALFQRAAGDIARGRIA